MRRYFIAADEEDQLAFLKEVVLSVDSNAEVVAPSIAASNPPDKFLTARNQWEATKNHWVNHLISKDSSVRNIDVAIVDLYLSNPPKRNDPEGFWILTAIKSANPDCRLILVTNKVNLSEVDKPPVPVEAMISIASKPDSREQQLSDVVRDLSRRPTIQLGSTHAAGSSL